MSGLPTTSFEEQEQPQGQQQGGLFWYIITWPYRFICRHSSWFCSAWEYLMLVVALYGTWASAVELFVMDQIPKAMIIVDIILALFIGLDVVLRFFNTAYQAHLVGDNRLLAVDRTPLGVDASFHVLDVLFGMLPILAFFIPRTEKDSGLLAYKILSSFRVWRIKRFSDYLARWEKDINCNYLCSRLVRLIWVTFVWVHYSACLLYCVAELVKTDGKDNWMTKYEPKLPSKGFWEQYFTAIYWSITIMSTTGLGDISPKNIWEKHAVSTFMIINIGFASYLGANLGSLVIDSMDRKKQFRKMIDSAKRFALRNNLPSKLRDPMLVQMLSNFQRNEEETTLQSFSKPILSKMSHDFFHEVSHRVYLLKGVSTELRTHLAYAMKMETFSPKDNIIWHNAVPDKLYLVVKGAVEMFRGDENGTTEVFVGDFARERLNNYVIYGEMGVICNEPQIFGVRARAFCRVLSLERSTFLQIVAGRNNDVAIMMKNIVQTKGNVETSSPPEMQFLEAMRTKARTMVSPPGGDNLLLQYLYENPTQVYEQ